MDLYINQDICHWNMQHVERIERIRGCTLDGTRLLLDDLGWLYQQQPLETEAPCDYDRSLIHVYSIVMYVSGMCDHTLCFSLLTVMFLYCLATGQTSRASSASVEIFFWTARQSILTILPRCSTKMSSNVKKFQNGQLFLMLLLFWVTCLLMHINYVNCCNMLQPLQRPLHIVQLHGSSLAFCGWFLVAI